MNELDTVVLTEDIPNANLTAGDVGTVVLIHDGGKGYEVEFTTLEGDTVAVLTLVAHQVRPVGQDEIAHARRLAS